MKDAPRGSMPVPVMPAQFAGRGRGNWAPGHKGRPGQVGGSIGQGADQAAYLKRVKTGQALGSLLGGGSPPRARVSTGGSIGQGADQGAFLRRARGSRLTEQKGRPS